MSKKILTRELIVSAAFHMIDENGTDRFSVRQLASKLGVQVSSLYNHINNEYDLMLEVAKLAAAMYEEKIDVVVEGLTPEESLFKGAEVFCDFVNEHEFLYDLLLDRRLIGDPEFEKVNCVFTKPIYYYIEKFNIKDKTARNHAYVALRVFTHGFASLDALGLFDGLSTDPKESYLLIANTVLDFMKNLSEKE